MNNSAQNNSSSPYDYVLRYQIAPGYHEADRIEELAQFCRQSLIAEVMLLYNAEELTTGHITLEELEPWINVACRVRDRLGQDGVRLSLNPWSTTFHVARGRRLRPDQDFQLMVGETGFIARITATPLCVNWQDYLCKQFAQIARRVDPVAIWIEDDWRLHNHEPEMGYGGCFSPLLLTRFSQENGLPPVTREEVLQAILAPGKPHPWRKLWLTLWRQTLLEPAIRLREAVHAANPRTRLGLMSSDVDVHSPEGREWFLLQQALGCEGGFLIRPHLPPYTQSHALATPPSVTRATVASLQRPLVLYPELENSPRSGPYSKSKAYTAWQCLHSVCYGSHGITINHFDMMGTGTALDPTFGQKLAQIKPQLDAIKSLGIDDGDALGPRVLFKPDISEHRRIPVESPAGMNSLINESLHFSQSLFILGIAHGLCVDVPVDGVTPIFASDRTLDALSDEEVNILLAGPLVLDGMAALSLVERGFGPAIGIEQAQWAAKEDTAFSFEMIDEADPAIHGLAWPRMSAQRCTQRVLHITPTAQARVRSWLKNGFDETLFPGLITTQNNHDGHVAVLAYPLGTLRYYMGFFNSFRRSFFELLLFELAPHAPLACVTNHPMHSYFVRTASGFLTAAINPTDDPTDGVTWRIRHLPAVCTPYRLHASGQWFPVKGHQQETLPDGSHRYHFEDVISPLQGLFIHWSSRS